MLFANSSWLMIEHPIGDVSSGVLYNYSRAFIFSTTQEPSFGSRSSAGYRVLNLNLTIAQQDLSSKTPKTSNYYPTINSLLLVTVNVGIHRPHPCSSTKLF